jgi:ubiquinone/menaquinone biosynthesis C-methylase UbiE
VAPSPAAELSAPERRAFWSGYQPGFRAAESPVGTREFFAEVSAKRYVLEPHIPEIVDFERWRGCAVLEAGCGIGTDGARFAVAGADYTGLDFSRSATALARRRFELERLPGRFVAGSVTALPFEDDMFDLVFSHGVIHHLPDTEAAVREFHRVLKPGGTVVVMLYHRHSLNYHVTIMLLRRAAVGLLLVPKASSVVARLTGEPEEVVAGHRQLLTTHGLRYLSDRDLFLSHNTDGPGNPLSKVYSRAEAARLFAPFGNVTTEVRFLNLRLYPGGSRLSTTRLARKLERRVGWHLYVRGQKAPVAHQLDRP